MKSIILITATLIILLPLAAFSQHDRAGTGSGTLPGLPRGSGSSTTTNNTTTTTNGPSPASPPYQEDDSKERYDIGTFYETSNLMGIDFRVSHGAFHRFGMGFIIGLPLSPPTIQLWDDYYDAPGNTVSFRQAASSNAISLQQSQQRYVQVKLYFYVSYDLNKNFSAQAGAGIDMGELYDVYGDNNNTYNLLSEEDDDQLSFYAGLEYRYRWIYVKAGATINTNADFNGIFGAGVSF